MSLGAQVADAGGRRFCLVVFAFAIYTILFALERLTEGGYITLQTMTIGAYIAGNGWQKHVEKKYGSSS